MLHWKRITWRLVRNVGYFYCASYAVGRHIGELVVCSGPSMHPTIQDGDLVSSVPHQVIAERLSVLLQNLRRGDIVGTLAPYDANEMLCKRLTAKEHDTVTNCCLLPNGKIPRGHVYLEGDNKMASTDSRVFGPVPAGLVQVRLILRIWPLSRAGWISTHWFWEKPNE
uniref:Peptidase S26 domain-containing protein n=1 Tax=Setaria digitata TaxID=48799 RepID=A0A915PKG1_9BILA